MDKPSEAAKRIAEKYAHEVYITANKNGVGEVADLLARIIDREYAPLVDRVRAAVEAEAICEIHLSLIREALSGVTNVK